MSKNSKLRSSEARKNKKRAHKAAQQAKYVAFAEKGANTKSKRGLKRAKALKGLTLRPRNHPFGKCGNLGCKTCYAAFNVAPEPGTFQYAVLKHFYPGGY